MDNHSYKLQHKDAVEYLASYILVDGGTTPRIHAPGLRTHMAEQCTIDETGVKTCCTVATRPKMPLKRGLRRR